MTTRNRRSAAATKRHLHTLRNSPDVAAKVYDLAGTRTADREVAAIMDQLLAE